MQENLPPVMPPLEMLLYVEEPILISESPLKSAF